MDKVSENLLDRLWSEAIKLLSGNKCQRCGSPYNLHSHHIWSRRYKNLRWDIQNGLCLCNNLGHSCHYFAHNSPQEFSRWVEKEKGQEWVDRMILKKNAIVKPSTFEIKLFLQALIDKLKGKPFFNNNINNNEVQNV